MDNKQIAEVLEEISAILELLGENPFKVRAYQNASRVIDGLPEEVRELVKTKKLTKIRGVGEHIAKVITDLVTDGESRHHQELKASVPPGLLEMLRIPGLGPKRVRALHQELGIKSVASVEKACRENKIASLEGFGEKSQTRILEAVTHHSKTQGHFLISQAAEDSKGCLAYLKQQKPVRQIEVAGSLRRCNEIVHDVDILVGTERPGPVHRAFASYPEVERVLARGETKSSVILSSGMQVDLRTVTPREFPYALHYFTGSKEHNVALRTLAKRKGLKISEYGLFKGKKLILCRDETELYRKFGMAFIPPELREHTGELEASKEGKLPKLIETKDIKGIFHVHSTYSDGADTLERMIEGAVERGYEYVGISDHSKSAFYANGLKEGRIKKQHAEIDKLQKKYKLIRIFRGIESDILGDGSLDYSDRVLKSFDFVIGSVHSKFTMSEKDMTRRVQRAMEHPAMTIWGHPSGRLLLGRSGYKVDYEALYETAAKRGVLIELNANPHRLDLDWRQLGAAKAKGIRVSINPDAHRIDGLDDVIYGIGAARKGWLERKDVFNTMSCQAVETYLAERRKPW